MWEEKRWGVRRDLFEGTWGQFRFYFLEIPRVVFPNFRVALLSVTGGPSKEKWGAVGGVILTSFLRPRRGLRRGRARFPGKHPAEAKAGSTPPLGLGEPGGGLNPGRRPREAPSLHTSSRERRLEPPAAQAVLSPAANHLSPGRSPSSRPWPSSSLLAAPAAPWCPARPARGGPRGQAPAQTVF